MNIKRIRGNLISKSHKEERIKRNGYKIKKKAKKKKERRRRRRRRSFSYDGKQGMSWRIS